MVRLLQLVLNAAANGGGKGGDASGGGGGDKGVANSSKGCPTDLESLKKIVDELGKAASKTNGQELELRVSLFLLFLYMVLSTSSVRHELIILMSFYFIYFRHLVRVIT